MLNQFCLFAQWLIVFVMLLGVLAYFAGRKSEA